MDEDCCCAEEDCCCADEDCCCAGEESNGDAAELDLNLGTVEGKPLCVDEEVNLGGANSEAAVEPRATTLDADVE